MLADIRHAVRSLFKHPIVAAAAVLSLALAIGANSAVFTLIEGIVLRPLPVPNPQRLFALTRISPSGEKSADAFSIAMFEELRRGQGVFSSQFVWLGGSMANFEVNGHLYPAALETVSGEYFETLGIHPYLGRFFTPADVALHAGRSAQVAVLSYRCWHERYQADPKILGKTLRVDGIPLTVIAVAPKGFGGIQIDAAADAIVPIGYKGLPQFREKKNAGFQIMGRLRPALTQRQAKAQIAQFGRKCCAQPCPTNGWESSAPTSSPVGSICSPPPLATHGCASV